MAHNMNSPKNQKQDHLNSEVVEKLIEENPEVKSYIYQQLIEFEPFVTPETLIAVVVLDPKKLQVQFETEGKDELLNNIEKLYRIGIVLSEGDSKIKAEATDFDLLNAIKKAKEKLIAKLSMIQDKVLSSQERIEQINSILQNNEVH